jgi:hypothetical protein
MILEVALENANLKKFECIHCDNIVSTIEVFNKAIIDYIFKFF